ncbi:hypothetical protein ALC53_02210 [Atta colombica]|uniref:Uncharacterized protein n=1 Tax=Atta colombica TaxID=520822 RepID=A0A195BT93_9HYME|nr:hypothetical protein ALC53_02210 [Atta colombica]
MARLEKSDGKGEGHYRKRALPLYYAMSRTRANICSVCSNILQPSNPHFSAVSGSLCLAYLPVWHRPTTAILGTIYMAVVAQHSWISRRDFTPVGAMESAGRREKMDKECSSSSMPSDIGRRTNDGGLARPQGCRYLNIYPLRMALVYTGVRLFGRSLSPDFPNKAPELLLRSGYVAKAGIWDFCSVSRRTVHFHDPASAVPSLSCSPLAVSCGHVTAPGMNPVERDETKRRKRERMDADTELRVGFGSGWTDCSRRSPTRGRY